MRRSAIALGLSRSIDKELEDLDDGREASSVDRLEGDPVLVAVASMVGRQLLLVAAVAVGGTAAGPVALLGGLAHPALGFA